MSLTKHKIGDLIGKIDERNNLGIRNFYGINKSKEFMPTVANTSNLDESKYKIVRKNRFVFSGMQTGRDQSIRLVMYTNEEPIIVSPAYTTFEVKATNTVLPLYLFMIFLSEEKDRLGWFLSDSSIRANLDWDVFCDIELNLPSLEIQKKYVDIYKALLANQEVYEEGLENLKLSCDATIENLQRELPHKKLGLYIERYDIRNGKDGTKNVKGISVEKRFRTPTSKVNVNALSNYKLVKPNDIAFVQTTHNEKVFAYALNNTKEDVVVSSVNEVFRTEKESLLPEYLVMFFNRTEFDRYARFHSWGSARETFTWDDLTEVKIPIPDMKIQKSIADIYNSYVTRSEINQKLKERIKAMCPILIKGAMEEASR